MTLKSGARSESFVHTTDDGLRLASWRAAADDYDARLRVYRGMVARRGQAAFRAAWLEAYGGKCSITACDATTALEATHLRPYRGPGSNTFSNGLPLRADSHTLFALRLLP